MLSKFVFYFVHLLFLFFGFVVLFLGRSFKSYFSFRGQFYGGFGLNIGDWSEVVAV